MRKRLLPLLGLVVLGTVLVGGPGPAAAHAALVGTDPEDGATLETLPSEVTLEFNEPVGSSSEVAVTAPDGSTVPVDDVSVLDREVTATVGESTVRGEHVIAFRVVSADGHSVAGEITVTTTQGATPEQQSGSADEGSDGTFVHRHREHLLWGALAAVAAIALIVGPLLRRRRS